MQGEWLCADCAAGRVAPPSRHPVTARQRFLAGQLGLVRIEALWQDAATDEVWYRGRWYCRPEETAEGRQVTPPFIHPCSSKRTWCIAAWGFCSLPSQVFRSSRGELVRTCSNYGGICRWTCIYGFA